MGFDQASVEKGAKSAELSDSGIAQAALLEDLTKISPKDQMAFLKSVSEQTKKDQNANPSLPTLELSDDGAGVKQVKPTDSEIASHTVENSVKNEVNDAVNKFEELAGGIVFGTPDAALKQVKPIEIPNYQGDKAPHDLLYTPSAAPAQIIRVHAAASKPAL